MPGLVRRAALAGALAAGASGRPAAAQPGAGAPLEVVAFRPPAGPVRPGREAASAIRVRNPTAAAARVWVGHSVQAPDGRWYDVEPLPAALPAGATTEYVRSWRAPADPVPGAYRAVMAVWSAPPGTPGARRLASVDRRDAFRVRGLAPLLVHEPPGPWRAGDHALGRGRVRPEQVLLGAEGGFRLQLRPGRCDGAEVRSAARYDAGEYTVRLRAPYAPGSLSAVFLYGDDGEHSDELDVELHNDGTRRALLTAWVRGVQRRQAEAVLPFDPAAGVHAYTIAWDARGAAFLADGAVLARWAGGTPRGPMHAMANVWWPAWLDCRPPAAPRGLAVESAAVRPVRPPAPRR